MVYASQKDVEFWGQLTGGEVGASGYSYEESIQRATQFADGIIDDHLDRPKDFFTSGGVIIENEYYDAVDVGYYGVYPSFAVGITNRPYLRLNHSPIITVIKLEELTAADTWTTRTEGSTSDYIVLDEGVRFISNVPKYDYKNIRVTYKVGYASTPDVIVELSGRLAAALIHMLVDSKVRDDVSVDGISFKNTARLFMELLTPNLKQRLLKYKRNVPIKVEW